MILAAAEAKVTWRKDTRQKYTKQQGHFCRNVKDKAWLLYKYNSLTNSWLLFGTWPE